MDYDKRKSVFLYILLGLLYALIFLKMPQNYFWNGDNGMKYIQAISLIHNDFKSQSLIYPGAVFDGNSEFMPADAAFCYKKGSEFYGQYSVYYVFLLAVLIYHFGEYGPFLLVYASMIFFVLSLLKLSEKIKPGGYFISFSIACCPVIFYAFSYYETILCCLLFSVFLNIFFSEGKSLKHHVIAGAALSLFCSVRIEGYLYAIVFGTAYLYPFNRLKENILFSASFVMVIFPLWVMNNAITGDILGPVFFTDHESENLAGLNFFELIFYRIDLLLLNLNMFMRQEYAMIIYVILCIIVFRKKTLLNLILCAGLVLESVIIYNNWLNRSFFLPSPLTFYLFPIIFLKSGRDRITAACILALAGMVVCFMNIENPHDWGSRYLVPVYPLVFYLVFKNTEIKKSLLIFLFCSSFFFEFAGITELRKRRINYSGRAEYLSESSENVILSDEIYFTQLYAALYDKKLFYYLFPGMSRRDINETVYSARFEAFLDMLLKNRITDFIFITASETFAGSDVKPNMKIILSFASGKEALLSVREKHPERAGRSIVKLTFLRLS